LRVALAASEVYPLARTGGLADVICSLPAALERSGHQVSLFIPMYRNLGSLPGIDWLPPCRTRLDEEFGLGRILHPATGTPVFLVSRDSYFDREGIYGPPEGGDFPDNSLRFSFFCRAVASAVTSLRFRPEVLHCHDWHTGLVPAYLDGDGPATVFTIHNLAYQGNFPRDQYVLTGLPDSLSGADRTGYGDGFSFMKAGIAMADAVSTVSPSYAREIQTPEEGMGMDRFLTARPDGITGILNGIDFDIWDPSADPALPATFAAGSLIGRKTCRRELCRELGIAEPGCSPVVGVVSRLTHQKGMDMVARAADAIVGFDMSMAILGAGEPSLEREMVSLSQKHPGRVSVSIGYDDGLARRIFAGSDVFLMPSRFEPCGLAQMMAMRYGCVPVVARTGGLQDTVTPVESGGTGYLFDRDDVRAMERVLAAVAGDFRDRRAWAWTRRRCMACNSSWSTRVGEYGELYARAAGMRRVR
jgi:starch synthase